MSHVSRGLSEDIKEEILLFVHPLGRLLASIKFHDVCHTHMRKCETLCIRMFGQPTLRDVARVSKAKGQKPMTHHSNGHHRKEYESPDHSRCKMADDNIHHPMIPSSQGCSEQADVFYTPHSNQVHAADTV